MATVDDRLNALERDVAFLREHLSESAQNGKWWEQITGSFRDQPEFDEVLRLGREFRKRQLSDEPQDDAGM